MSTTTIPNVPLPAGAIEVGDWKRSPNDAASYRYVEGPYFPSRHDIETGEGLADELCVYTQGFDVVEDSGARSITLEIFVGDRLRLSPDQAVKLAGALTAAARYVAGLEGVNQIDTLMSAAQLVERAELCKRVRDAVSAVPNEDWTVEEIRALVTVVEAVVSARRR